MLCSTEFSWRKGLQAAGDLKPLTISHTVRLFQYGNPFKTAMPAKSPQLEVVMAYIDALDRQEYEAAMNHLHEDVRIRGPAGETFGKPYDFIEMLRKHRGKYDIKRAFADGDDVCLLYDLKTKGPTVFMSSWYRVDDGKIASIHTVFDPRAFGPPSGKTSG